MIDFHNHIIPNLDDGSKSIEMSLNMLREAEHQGITDVVNTVHFQHPKMMKKNTSYDFVINEINNLQSELDKQNINIKIHPASEVFFNFNLTKILDNPITTFGNSKYMLIEFQKLSFPKGYEDEIFKLQLEGITPIIAHPERYRAVQKDFNYVRRWIDRGYIIQIDCASILGKFGKETQICSKNLLKNEFCHLVGSDAHNDKNRNFLLKDTHEMLNEYIGNEATNIIKNNSKRIFAGKDCLKYNFLNEKKSFFSLLLGYFKRKKYH